MNTPTPSSARPVSIARDFALSSVVAGFITVLVGYTSSAAIVFEAARASGATPDQIGSWMGALGLGMAFTCIALSLWFREPIVTAWSTPGAALLISAAAGVPMTDIIGAFVLCGVLITLAGMTGAFERLMSRIPVSLAAALLAGVLVRFGIQAFAAAGSAALMVGAMFLMYLIGRRLWPRYTIPVVLLTAIALTALQGGLQTAQIEWALAKPIVTMPSFSVHAAIGIAVPLFVVTMASQNLPGVATLRSHGYRAPISPLITVTGLTTLVLAPFGGFAINLAAITAAICMGREAHERPEARYSAAVCAGIFYGVLGVFGAAVGSVFSAFPREAVLALAGLALIGTIASGLAQAMKEESEREPALITFLVTASGLTLAGVGSAFWGVMAGLLATAVLRFRR